MAQEPQPVGGQAINRVFEQPADAISFYCDLAQVVGTPNEIVLQFYETIPGPPSGSKGDIQMARSRLRATVVVSQSHATNIGQLLLQKVTAQAQKQAADSSGGSKQPPDTSAGAKK
jgi:hypothetical protein